MLQVDRYFMNELDAKKWLDLAREIQSLGQIGLAFSDNHYEIARNKRLIEMASEITENHTNLEKESVNKVLMNHPGYATPKVDVRAVVKDGKLLAVLQSKKIDLLISINCSQKLNVAEYSYPRLGSINIHNSDLPKYGGLMPILHAIRNDDKKSGVTVHYISNELDKGDIIAKDYVTISPSDNLFSVWKRSVDVGANLLTVAITNILSSDVVRQRNVGKASYFSFPTIRQILQYRKSIHN